MLEFLGCIVSLGQRYAPALHFTFQETNTILQCVASVHERGKQACRCNRARKTNEPLSSTQYLGQFFSTIHPIRQGHITVDDKMQKQSDS
jgi:hypothetical protein